MSGTTAEIIPIVIVPVVILAFWLGMMFYVNSHPQWGGRVRADNVSTHALAGSVPTQPLSGPGRVIPGQRPATAGGEAAPEQPQVSQTQRE
jgi:hypothetical protein